MSQFTKERSRDIDTRIKFLHTWEFSQRDIAAKIGVSQRCVCYRMKKLGLKPHGHATERSRKKKRKAYYRFCEANGVPSLAFISETIPRLKREVKQEMLRRIANGNERRMKSKC